MRTDEQKLADAKASVNSLSAEQLREKLLTASVLLELRLLDTMFPSLDEDTIKSWLDTTWELLKYTRSEEHMQELITGINERVEKLKLLMSDTETAQ